MSFPTPCSGFVHKTHRQEPVFVDGPVVRSCDEDTEDAWGWGGDWGRGARPVAWTLTWRSDTEGWICLSCLSCITRAALAVPKVNALGGGGGSELTSPIPVHTMDLDPNPYASESCSMDSSGCRNSPPKDRRCLDIPSTESTRQRTGHLPTEGSEMGWSGAAGKTQHCHL